jgi:hypothetical protein
MKANICKYHLPKYGPCKNIQAFMYILLVRFCNIFLKHMLGYIYSMFKMKNMECNMYQYVL